MAYLNEIDRRIQRRIREIRPDQDDVLIGGYLREHNPHAALMSMPDAELSAEITIAVVFIHSFPTTAAAYAKSWGLV